MSARKPALERAGLGERLTKFRIHMGLSQKEAAEKFGVGRRTWNRYETENREPKAPVLAFLAQSGLNIAWLLDGEGAGPMLLSGQARQAQADYIGSLAGDQEAAAQSEVKGKAALQRLRECTETLHTLSSEVDYEPDAVWAAVLQELMFIHEVSPTAIRRILETLKTAEQSQGGNHHGAH